MVIVERLFESNEVNEPKPLRGMVTRVSLINTKDHGDVIEVKRGYTDRANQRLYRSPDVGTTGDLMGFCQNAVCGDHKVMRDDYAKIADMVAKTCRQVSGPHRWWRGGPLEWSANPHYDVSYRGEIREEGNSAISVAMAMAKDDGVTISKTDNGVEVGGVEVKAPTGSDIGPFLKQVRGLIKKARKESKVSRPMNIRHLVTEEISGYHSDIPVKKKFTVRFTGRKMGLPSSTSSKTIAVEVVALDESEVYRQVREIADRMGMSHLRVSSVVDGEVKDDGGASWNADPEAKNRMTMANLSGGQSLGDIGPGNSHNAVDMDTQEGPDELDGGMDMDEPSTDTFDPTMGNHNTADEIPHDLTEDIRKKGSFLY